MALNMNKLTEKAQEAIAAAQRLAEERQQYPARARAPARRARRTRRTASCRPCWRSSASSRAHVAPAARAAARRGLRAPTTPQPGLRLAAASARCSTPPQQEADRLKDDYVSHRALPAGLADGQDEAGAVLLRELGVTRDRVYQALQEVRGGQRVTSQNPETTYQSLEQYGRDLTALARAGQARPGHRPRRGDPPRHPGPARGAPRTTRC